MKHAFGIACIVIGSSLATIGALAVASVAVPITMFKHYTSM